MKYLPSSNWCTYCTAHGTDPEARDASEGLRRPCALASGRDIQVWHYPRNSSINTDNKPATDNPHSPIGASALSIAWSLCSGGIWARNVSIGRRAVVTEKGGKRSYPQVRLTDPEQSVHARDTWQHTDRYRTVTDPYPPRHPGKTKLRTDARCAHACSAYLAMLTRGGGARSKRGRDSQPPTHPRISPETCTNRRQGELPSRPHPRRRPQPPRRAKNGRDRCKSP